MHGHDIELGHAKLGQQVKHIDHVPEPGLLVGAQVKRLRTVAVELERDLLQVQDDVGRILNHSGNGLKLVQHIFNANCGHGFAFNRAQQRTPQSIADRRAETPLKGLRAELAKGVGQRLGIYCKPLRFLESSPQHTYLSVPTRHVRRDAFCGGRASAPWFVRFQVSGFRFQLDRAGTKLRG